MTDDGRNEVFLPGQAREALRASQDSRRSSEDPVFSDEDKDDDIGTPYSKFNGSSFLPPVRPGVKRGSRMRSVQTEMLDDALASQESTIARAKVDATLAVIPAAAFKRLTKIFPKASAHIVQGELYCI